MESDTAPESVVAKAKQSKTGVVELGAVLQPETAPDSTSQTSESVNSLVNVKSSAEVALSSIRRAAMDLLARREHSRYELISKLERRFQRSDARASGSKYSSDKAPRFKHTDEADIEVSVSKKSFRKPPSPSNVSIAQIEAVVDRLREEKLQCDERYTEAFVRYRSNKGQGPLRIAQDLKAQRVCENLISNYLYRGEIDWFENALVVKEKKYGGVENLFQVGNQNSPKPDAQEQVKLKAKQRRFLQSRGFTFDQIHYALSESK